MDHILRFSKSLLQMDLLPLKIQEPYRSDPPFCLEFFELLLIRFPNQFLVQILHCRK